MNITLTRNGDELTVALDGRLDTFSSPELEETLENSLEGIKKLTFDLKELKYISSSGLRVLSGALDVMEEQGEMYVANICDDVREVFEFTGFIEDLNII